MRKFKKRPYSNRYKLLIVLGIVFLISTCLTAIYGLYVISILLLVSGISYFKIAFKLPIREKFKQK